MDDLAPIPTQRTFVDAGRTQEAFTARKKAAKKVAPPKKQAPAPEVDPEVEPKPDHQLDLLA
jgi:hypothetical protein